MVQPSDPHFQEQELAFTTKKWLTNLVVMQLSVFSGLYLLFFPAGIAYAHFLMLSVVYLFGEWPGFDHNRSDLWICDSPKPHVVNIFGYWLTGKAVNTLEGTKKARYTHS